jgi:hypothetical protein
MDRCSAAALLCLLALSGCGTYAATAVPDENAPYAVLPNRVVQAPVSISLTAAAAEASPDIETPNLTCSANGFALAMVAPLEASLGAVDHVAFPHQVSSGGDYRVTVAVESYAPTLSFWDNDDGVTADAKVDLLLDVAITGKDGKSILATKIDGRGASEETGGCDVGADALQEAASKALRHIAKDYAYQVVNSGLMK